MALTPKQMRNQDISELPAGGNVAQPGPTPDVESVMRSAESAAGGWAEQGAGIWQGGTAGTPGFSVADWDSNLAVTEQPGEV